MKKLENKTVFISGGLSGIGKAAAIEADIEGANIVIVDRERRANIKAINEIRAIQPNALFVQCNVSIAEEVKNAVDKTVKTFGSLDVALNNASILVETLKQKSGEIVDISSIYGKILYAKSAHYIDVKHGILGLTKTATLEYTIDGIRVNVICPGFIETPLFTKLDLNNNPERKRQLLINIP